MRILVVDDEPMIRELLSEFLVDHGHEVLEAENGQAAWETLSGPEGFCDLVFADLKMPVMDGRELLRRLQEVRPELPVVLISGQINVTVNDARYEGAHQIIHKPIRFQDIRSLLEGLEPKRDRQA